ncbi:MAG: 1-acyl-sn-glycerol-3-phosphate acyltransferase [Flavobacteriales bacterium]|nr:MAG: 1-acyl-sn-glycerol-3-phosphate acyltransferase [Flavobacteriales bacterium]
MFIKVFYPLQVLWRLWFFVAVFIAIVLVFPFITLFSIRKSWYKYFFRFARIWAYLVVLLSGFYPSVKGRKHINRKKSYIIIANHTSMIDIMLTYISVPSLFLFIGKKELESWPIFGYFYKRTNILVDRKSLSSRRDVYYEARKSLQNGVGVCIYPEGGVPDDPTILLWPFKIGAFKLAVEEKIELLPITFPDTKRKHPYSFLDGGSPGRLRARIHPPISTENYSDKELRDQAFALMSSALERDLR